MKNVVVFASGSGTNTENLLSYYTNHSKISICAVFTNNKNAGVVQIANKHNIPCLFLTRDAFYNSEIILSQLFVFQPSLIVLAGFLWLIPKYLIEHYSEKIINIHPALLPKHGGKGMIGNKVHEEVLACNDIESGITIHYVNEKYDEGEIILQVSCEVKSDDNVESLSNRIHKLEYEHLPKAIKNLLTD